MAGIIEEVKVPTDKWQVSLSEDYPGCKTTNYYTVQATIMKWEVTLYVGGTVFKEEVRAVNREDAKDTALARNPTARLIGVNPIVGG